MAKLSDLGLTNEKIGADDVDFDNLPKVGGFQPLLQPGRYRFKLPANLVDVFDPVASKNGPRIAAIFDQSSPLTVIKAPDPKRVGEPFTTRISNVERPRGRDKLSISDMDYLLRALGHKRKPHEKYSNTEYGMALVQHAGEEFDATIEFQWHCSAEREIYVDDGTGNTTKVEGRMGCGSRYYQKDVDRLPDGSYPERLTCIGENCGASLRAFAQLSAIG